MQLLNNIQFIEQNGYPVFAIIPYDQFLELISCIPDKPSPQLELPLTVLPDTKT